MARKESELSFPLSTHYALHGSWQQADENPVFIRAEQALVKEMNRRMVSEAERLVFYYQPAAWISKLFKKADLSLNKIEWHKGQYLSLHCFDGMPSSLHGFFEGLSCKCGSETGRACAVQSGSAHFIESSSIESSSMARVNSHDA